MSCTLLQNHKKYYDMIFCTAAINLVLGKGRFVQIVLHYKSKIWTREREREREIHYEQIPYRDRNPKNIIQNFSIWITFYISFIRRFFSKLFKGRVPKPCHCKCFYSQNLFYKPFWYHKQFILGLIFYIFFHLL